MCLDVGYGKMQLVRVSSCRLGAAVLPLRREAFGKTEPLRPFGTPPLSGEAFGASAECGLAAFLLHDAIFSAGNFCRTRQS